MLSASCYTPRLFTYLNTLILGCWGEGSPVMPDLEGVVLSRNRRKLLVFSHLSDLTTLLCVP
jgi:hypothetical protein